MSDDIVLNYSEIQKLASKKLASNADGNTMKSLADPFADKVETAFFATSNLNSQLDEVIHLCQFGGNVVTLLGSKGVGKTAFLSEVRKELSETSYCCTIDSALMMTAEDIFRQVISQLELPVAPTSNVGQMLVALRKTMADSSMHRVVIVIDDADFLNESILSALLSLFQGANGGQFHLLLSGDKNLIERLDELEIVDVLIYDIHLNPFSVDEAKNYINFKLSLVGKNVEEYFRQGEINSIYKESKGFPYLINKAAQKHLYRIENSEDLNPLDVDRKTGLPLLHMGLLIILLAGLIMTLIYMGDNEQAQTQPVAAIVLDQPTITEAKPDAIDLAIEKLNTERQVGTPTQNNLISSSKNTDLAENNSQPQVADINNAEVNQPIDTQAQEKTRVTNQNELTNNDTINTIQKTNIAAAPKVDQVLNSDLKKQLELEAQSLTLNKPATAEQTKTDVKNINNDGAVSQFSANEKTVLDWADTSYTLQLIGAEQKPSLVEYIAEQPNASQLLLLSLLRNGKPWYVVVTGVYEDAQVARRAVQSLPQNQVNGGPWPKNISDLKRDTQAFRRK
jgi:DamX protein